MNEKQKFMIDQCWILTISGAFGHSKVYNKDDQNVRTKFRNTIREKIEEIIFSEYTNEIDSDTHYRQLEKYKEWIDNNCQHYLHDNVINIGNIQKIFNLFLKYLWCMDIVFMPPHCPIDRTIISHLPMENPPAWTQITTIEEYKRIITAINESASSENLSIAEWELIHYNQWGKEKTHYLP